MSQSEKSNSEKKSYSSTLNLPKTDFPIRAQAKIDDEKLLNRWAEQELYKKAFVHNQGKETFILHDGPPYANGDIHIGHAYNKILKDIVVKSERMRGKHAPVTPGWDCHGLPIELKVIKTLEDNTDRVALKKACREYAQKWVDVQSAQFQKLGVVMDWAHPYLTMNFEYQSKILEAFASFVEQGYIQRQQKTVPWCSSCETVLANAEIEYQDRKDPSVYVQFPFPEKDAAELFPQAGGAEVSLLVWTTTPWTLPLNRAVALKPGAEYQLVKINDRYVICGKELVEKVAALAESEYEVVNTFVSEKIIGKQVHQPFKSDRLVPIIENHLISLDDGTACVHIAPGCGPEDYDLGVKNGLEIYSPVSPAGIYVEDIEIDELLGARVQDGQFWVIKKLKEIGTLFLKKNIKHSYPHCWRCQNGLIFRATNQWFCNLSQNNLRSTALEAIDQMDMLPETGGNRLKASVEGRLEWCLSRQRTWGIPIPALSCESCDHVFLDQAVMKKVIAGIAEQGSEFWDTAPVSELITDGLACSECSGTSFAKEYDILDVWFDSGVSNYAVLKDNPALGYPADIYLEGKDQHRGWFQSSLLASLVLEKKPAMKSILTHGFTVDAKGHKMSKSRGNVVSPTELIEKMGTDGVRLWVASSDFDSDPVVSDVLLKNVSEVYRKIRNTCRFLLSNLDDFDVEKDSVAYEDLLLIDQYALYELAEFQRRVLDAYAARKTTAVFHELADYCVKSLSSFYLDISKDRLYVERADGKLRRSAQTVYYQILDALTKLMAPILSFTAELVSDHYQSNKTESIHLQDFASLSFVQNSEAGAAMALALEIRSLVLKQLEALRGQGEIKHSLDAAVTLCVADDRGEYKELCAAIEKSSQSLEQFWKDLCIVSQFSLHNLTDGLKEVVPGIWLKCEKAAGDKCARCWQWEESVSHNDQLCQRCKTVIG